VKFEEVDGIVKCTETCVNCDQSEHLMESDGESSNRAGFESFAICAPGFRRDGYLRALLKFIRVFLNKFKLGYE
jgi:hypothetical protein